MPDLLRYLRARHVATMTDVGVIEDGCVVVGSDGRIVAIGRTADLDPPHAHVNIDGLLAPGLINAHTHLELSDRTPGELPEGGFAAWLARLIRHSATNPDELADQVTESVAAGVEQCLRFGITAVGDITRNPHLSRPLFRHTPLRVVSFGEVTAMGSRRHLLQERVAAAVDTTYATDRLRVGVTPHAPYSVEATGYRYCLETAHHRDLPLTTHWAESADEAAFLAEQSGSLRGLWDLIGGLGPDVPRFAGGPIRFARSLGLLDYPTLLAHVNYCDDRELNELADGLASVVWCPRTHAYFRHPPHRWRAMKQRGVRVCIGTDSCASSPDLNVMDDLRLVRQQNPDLTPSELWPLITSDAADALEWGDGLGRLAAGVWADLTAWPTHGGNPLGEVLETPTMTPSGVWIGGALVPSPVHHADDASASSTKV